MYKLSNDLGAKMHLRSQRSVNIRSCRVCMTTKYSNSVKLDDVYWLQLFQYCLGITVNLNSSFKILCGDCAEYIKQYAAFKKQSLKSDSIWQSLQKNDPKCCIEKSDDIVAEVEYIDHHDIKMSLKQTCEDFEADNDDNINNFNDVLMEINDGNVKEEEDEGKNYDFKTLTDVNNVYEMKYVENISKDNKEVDICLKERKLKNQIENLECRRCGKEYKFKKSLIKHMEGCRQTSKICKKNIKVSSYFCGLCDTTLSNFNDLKQHLNEHWTINDLGCKLCDYIGSDVADIITHRFQHQSKDSFKYICHICNKMTYRQMSLQFHYRSVHLKKAGGVCTVCKKTFTKFKMWANHENKHKTGKYICDLCGKKFYYRYRIQEHLIDHSDVRQYMCELCGKSFKRMYTLRLHNASVHDVGGNVTCSHCNKTFKSAVTLKKHLHLLNLDKPFRCEICSKLFSSETVLNSHMFWHTGERPFTCDVCGSKYKAKSYLKLHKITKHSGFRPYKCLVCEKCFATSRALKRHQSAHTGVRPYKCTQCDRSFHCKKLLKEHYSIRHKDLDDVKAESQI